MSILSLPPELLLGIAESLPQDAILSLKLTHPYFNENLFLNPRVKNMHTSECVRFALRAYLSRPTPQRSHIRCIYCKNLYPPSLFNSSNSPACITTSREGTDVVDLPPRLCAWHVGRLARIVHTSPGGKDGWTSEMDVMCMHCGNIQGWAKCLCRCDSCAYRPVRVYTRHISKSKVIFEFKFWRETGDQKVQGRLMVRETWYDANAADQKAVINLPVQVD